MERVSHPSWQIFRFSFLIKNYKFCSLQVFPELTKLMLRDRKSCTLQASLLRQCLKMMLHGLHFVSVNIKDGEDEIRLFSAHMLLTVQN